VVLKKRGKVIKKKKKKIKKVETGRIGVSAATAIYRK